MESGTVETLKRLLEDPAPTDLAETALVLASLTRPRVSLARYKEHLKELGRAAADRRNADAAEDRASVLADVMVTRYGYRGDNLTYDDLQNANLMRVIDRRRGLPVALGILYIHTARCQGWPADGLGFPGHFLIRVGDGNNTGIIDPFHDGALIDAAGLRGLLQNFEGPEATLAPHHYAPVEDRQVLLRLQNNIKTRLIQADRLAPASRILDAMLLISPDHPGLWHELALVQERLGNIKTAIAAAEQSLSLRSADAADPRLGLLASLRGRLN